MKRSVATVLFVIGAPAVLGFAPSALRPSSSALSMAKRGRGGLSGAVSKNKLNSPKSIGGPDSSDGGSPKSNWVQTSIPSINSLPKEKDVVRLVDTDVFALVNKQTNPTGAVCIVNYGDKTYCFSSSCSSCKIPLAKSKVLGPSEETKNDARLECDFCGATYNLRDGSPVKKAGGKLLGFLFDQGQDEKLPVYGLGERGGKVFINIP